MTEQLRPDGSLRHLLTLETLPRALIERLLDRTSDIRINERIHGPANDRRYQYVPTYILRGLMELHLEFTPA